MENSKEFEVKFCPYDGTIIITKYSGNSKQVVIPDVIDGRKVRKIGSFVFCECLTSIVLPSSLTHIGSYAFYGCSSLTIIEIPNSVTSIGDMAFYDCSSLTGVYISDIASWCAIYFGILFANPLYYANNLYINNQLVTDLEIPSNVTSIGNFTFNGCSSLIRIVMPNSVTSIGKFAFWNCSNLTSIVIPSSVTSIGGDAFYGCNGLTIYCEAESKPSGWNDNWNSSKRPVVWNCAKHRARDNGINRYLPKDEII